MRLPLPPASMADLNWPVMRATSLLEQGRVAEAVDYGPRHPGLERRHAGAGTGLMDYDRTAAAVWGGIRDAWRLTCRG